MPTKQECIEAVTAGGLSRTEAREIVDQLVKKKRQLAASGKLDRAEAELARAWGETVREMRIHSAQMRKHAALSILRRKENEAFIDSAKGENISFLDALEARMGGSGKRFAGARDSVTRRRWAIEGQWTGSMLNELEALDGPALRLLREDKTFHADVIREMMEPDSSGNALARQVADIFSRHAEQSRVRLNAAGAFVGRLEGWAPQSHDPVKIGSKALGGKDGWVEFVMERLDTERSFPGKQADEVREILAEVHETMVTGRDRGVTARQKGQYVGPSNLARGMGRSRVLHFRDAGAFLEYNQRYGQGNIFTNMVDHLTLSARKVALMEVFGPNPEVMIQSLIDDEALAIRKSSLTSEEKTKQLARLKRAWSPGKVVSGRLAHLFAELNGETFGAVNPNAAKIAAGVRNTQAMAKLTGAVLSALADVFVKMTNLRVHGHNLLESVGKAMDMRFERFTPQEQKRIYRALGTMTEGTLDDINTRWNAQESVQGYGGLLLNKFFKWSGLTPWTEAHKSGFARHLSVRLGDVRAQNWDGLDADLREVLRWHGFDAEKWDVIRQAASKEADGNWHILPENVSRLEREQVRAALVERLEQIESGRGSRESKDRMIRRETDRVRRELETLLSGYYMDETRTAVLEPDDRTRATMIRGTRAGTVEGEALRFLMQFKSFSFAYIQRILGGRRWRRASLDKDMLGASQFVVSALVFGYVAMTAKDLSKGRTPRDPSKWETWAAAFAQSGGLGIYGDFIFGRANRFGGGFLGTIAGPTISTASNIGVSLQDILFGEPGKGGAGLLREAVYNTPFINMWYTRAAMDYFMTMHVMEMISPGTVRRSKRRIKREFEQDYWLPVENIKRGGGFRR